MKDTNRVLVLSPWSRVKASIVSASNRAIRSGNGYRVRASPWVQRKGNGVKRESVSRKGSIASRCEHDVAEVADLTDPSLAGREQF